MRIYSNSRLTRVFVRSLCMTALEMNFIATLWPVIVCMATEEFKRSLSKPINQKSHQLDALLTFPKEPSAISSMMVYSPNFSGENIVCELMLNNNAIILGRKVNQDLVSLGRTI